MLNTTLGFDRNDEALISSLLEYLSYEFRTYSFIYRKILSELTMMPAITTADVILLSVTHNFEVLTV
jgi:hypothetical protein